MPPHGLQGTGCCQRGEQLLPSTPPPLLDAAVLSPPGWASMGLGGNTLLPAHPAPVLPRPRPPGDLTGLWDRLGGPGHGGPQDFGGWMGCSSRPAPALTLGRGLCSGVGGEAGALGAQCQAVPSTHSMRHLSPCEVMQGYDIITPPSPSLVWDAATGAPYHPPKPQKKPQSSAKLTRVYCFTSPPRPYKTRGLKAPRVRGQGGPR